MIVTIELRCWAASIGGEHYTAAMYKGGEGFEKTEIRHNMTSGLAGRLNKKDGCRNYRPGDSTGRFETESSAIKRGIEAAREKYHDIKCILVGSYAVADPQKIVWCENKSLMDEANKLWTEFEAFYDKTNNPWRKHEKRMMELSDKWEKLTGKPWD